MKKVLSVLLVFSLMLCFCSCKVEDSVIKNDWYVDKEFSDGSSYLTVFEDDESVYFYIDGFLICGVAKEDVKIDGGVYVYETVDVVVYYDGSVRVDDGLGTYPNPFIELEDPWKSFDVDYLMSYDINGMSLGDVYGYYDNCDVVEEETQNIYELLNYLGEEEFLYLTECFSDNNKYIEYISICGSYECIFDAANIAEYALEILRCHCSEYSYEFEKIYNEEEFQFVDNNLVIEYLENCVVIKIYNTNRVVRG